MTKEGSFEWIIGFEDIRKYFHGDFTGHYSSYNGLRALEIGCGTSTLSLQLSSELKYGQIVSIDNDAECIEHMRKLYSNRSELSWFVYDMIEDRGIKQNNCLDNDEYFHVIFDKGTFDAIHVEGSVSPLLQEVHRLLAVNGVYILFSINTSEYLYPLLSIDELSFTVSVHELELSTFKVATVLICKKTSSRPINIDILNTEEKRISDLYFKDQKPLLTPELEEYIKSGFGLLANNDLLSVRHTYELLSDAKCPCVAEFQSYSIDLFEEDLEVFPLSNSGFMSVNEVLSFIRTMQ